jgi:hypothetical protein
LKLLENNPIEKDKLQKKIDLLIKKESQVDAYMQACKKEKGKEI